MGCIALAIQGNLPSPVCGLGSRTARTGQPAPRHLHHGVGVFHAAHGQLLSGCSGRWTGGRGRPRTTSRGLRGVADGAEESEDGHAVPPGRCPPAKAPRLWKDGGQRGVGAQRTQRTRQLSTRDVSWRPAPWDTTRVHSCGGRRNGNRGCMVAPWRSTTGAEPCAVQACAAGRGAESLTQSRGVRRETPESSTDLKVKARGDKSMSEKREALEGVYGAVPQDPCDRAKATLPES